MHDNRVVGYEVDCDNERIVLHTRFDEKEPVELTDVVFEGVIAYQFEGDSFNNILLGVDEVNLQELVGDNEALFARWRPCCWPGPWNESTDAVLRHFESNGGKAYVATSAIGLAGWVVAQACRFEAVK